MKTNLTLFNHLLFSFFLFFFSTISVNGQSQIHSVLKDINPGAADGAPQGLTSWNGKLYFGANDGVHGLEPWVSDGTEQGTHMLKDINPGSGDSYSPSTLHLDNYFSNYFRPGAGGKLYFVATTALNGQEVWTTDGTESGTTQLTDIAAGSASSNPAYFKNLNNYTLFTAFINGVGSLFRTDGTEAGTTLLAPIRFRHSHHIVFNNKLYFTGESTGTGNELFVTDGTPAGSYIIKELMPGEQSATPTYFTRLGNAFLFNAQSSQGKELWISDGTNSGTQILKDIYPGANNSGNPDYLVTFQDKIFFSASDTAGEELWVTDGTEAGTKQFKNLNTNAGAGADVFGLTVFDNQLWFCASTPAFQQSLWKSDGTPEGTVGLNQYSYGSHKVAGNKMYFASKQYPQINNGSLWVTDGSTPTQIPYYIAPNQGGYTSSFYTYEIMPVGNEVFTTSKFANLVGYELSKVSTVTSVSSSVSGLADATVFPNPAHDWLSLKLNYDAQTQTVIVLDVMGRPVITTTDPEKIDVRFLASGVYSLRFGNDVYLFTKE